MKKIILPVSMLMLTTLSGCVTTSNTESNINSKVITNVPTEDVNYHELKHYKVAKDTQVQLVASDLAIEMGVDGVEWNKQLHPWSYKTLRTRTIAVSQLDKQQAYISLFSDTGLLPRYDEQKNRIFVEPYKTKLKLTYNFEPTINIAKIEANKIGEEEQLEKLASGENKEYYLYGNETLQDSLNGWAQEAGYQSIIWYIKDQKQKDIITKLNKANEIVIERSPAYAIQAVLEKVNNSKVAPSINMRVDTETGSLVFHGLNENEPFKVFTVKASGTKEVMEDLASSYDATLHYNAANYLINEEYKTIINSRIQLTLNEIFHDYPLNIEYDETINTIKVTSNEKSKK